MTDLHKGEYITVVGWHEDPNDYSFFGEPLLIHGLQDNFISVSNKRHKDEFIFIIDTSKADIIILNDDYVVSFNKPKEKSTWSCLKRCMKDIVRKGLFDECS